MKSIAEICKEAGLTYDGFAIGLPDEYYKENDPKGYLLDKINTEIKRELKKDNKRMNMEVDQVAYEEALKRLRL